MNIPNFRTWTKNDILDFCLHPGRLSLFLILLCVLIIVGAAYSETKQEVRYIEYCMQQDVRLTQEDCYWKWETLKASQPKTTVMPVVIPMR